jgi:hypothetical protein
MSYAFLEFHKIIVLNFPAYESFALTSTGFAGASSFPKRLEPFLFTHHAKIKTMQTTLEQAISKLQTLPPEKQEFMAAVILEELKADVLWDETFANSQKELKLWAQQALKEIEAGDIEEADEL